MEYEGARRRHGRRANLLGQGGGTGGGADLISALPEDLLLQVLVRLRCARAAARTSLLSRHWRGVWTQLPDLVFRNVTFASLPAALTSIQARVSLLDICVPRYGLDAAGVPSLLHAAARLSPVDFTLSLPRTQDHVDVELPRFRRATSIQLSVHNLRITPPPGRWGGFPALETLSLSLSGCCVDLAALVLRCPRLRVLWVDEVSLDDGINIRSESLQEVYIETDYVSTDCIKVEAPVLKELTMLFHAHHGADLRVSVVAPILEKVYWECLSYYRSSGSKLTAGLAPWGLSKLTLHAADSLLGEQVITGAGEEEDTSCLQLSNSNGYVLSLQMSCWGWFDAELNFAQQIEKHLVTDFSVLELIMQYDYGMGSAGHVFGPFVLHLLGSHRIRTATRQLRILFRRSKVKQECRLNCPCDEPKNWRCKDISLINLEEVVIDGFEWEDHEFDFLKVIFRCAPMLKRMVVGTLYNVTSNNWCTELYDIFKAYPLVECKLMPH